jgi:hypothetical protein
MGGGKGAQTDGDSDEGRAGRPPEPAEPPSGHRAERAERVAGPRGPRGPYQGPGLDDPEPLFPLAPSPLGSLSFAPSLHRSPPAQPLARSLRAS